MAKDVLVFVESRGGQVKRPSLEALSEGRRVADALGTKLHALLAGTGVGSLTERLAPCGPDSVLLADHELLALYHPEAFSEVFAAAIRSRDASTVLLSATAMGRDLAARTAASLDAGLASDCTHVAVTDGELRVQRPVYSGKALATVRFTGLPAFATLRPNVFPLEKRTGATPAVERLSVPLDPDRVRARTLQVVASSGAELDVAEASIVVSGGRAMKGPENFALIRELAGALGGSMGASRAAVDAGWVDHQYQVGQTGKVVAPNLYIACGISGAIQHWVGMMASKNVLAINNDPEAPMVTKADYAVIGDLHPILEAIVAEVKKRKGL